MVSGGRKGSHAWLREWGGGPVGIPGGGNEKITKL